MAEAKGAVASLGRSRSMLNLLLDFGDLEALLRRRLAELGTSDDSTEAILDSFLFAAGMNQVLEDYLCRDLASLGRVARHLPQVLDGRLGAPAARAAIGVRDAGSRVRDRLGGERSLAAHQHELEGLVRRLAEAVATEREQAAAERADLLRHARAVLDPLADAPPALRRSVIRLAHCFRSFDQRPADCRRLGELVAGRFTARERPLLVVGLRTSGSYLAPLCAAYLTLSGYQDVETMTLRPGHRWPTRDAARVAHARREDRLVCLVDDPPRSGRQLAQAADELMRAGIARGSLVLLLQLFGAVTSIPAVLAELQTLTLPWSEWSVHRDLTPAAVRDALSRALAGRREVAAVERAGPPPASLPGGRGHAAAVFRAVLVDADSGERVEQRVLVKGVGLGYLGRHSLAVARRLAEYVPPVYALENGLLYRAWMPEERRVGSRDDPAKVAAGIVAYVTARREALAVAEDMSDRLVGRGAVWDLVADMLGEAYGRGKYPVRPLADRAARRLVRPHRPAIVDGDMALSHWFATGDRVVKVDFDARAFSNEDAYCYDPVFDLASAAADRSETAAFAECDDAFGEALRRGYEAATGDPISDERWLLYQLLSHRRRSTGRRAPERVLAAETAMARAYQAYFGKRYFADVAHPAAGPLCAIDVDWVLETRWLSFPATSPAGALALRALMRHGYRPVIATGRSLPELRDRCHAYRLAGGVGEYGAVAYDQRSRRVRCLLSESDRNDLRELRRVLEETPGVWLDPRYRCSIRAYRVDAEGRRRGLDSALVQAALERAGGGRVSAVAAVGQTDFTVAGIDKGAGLEALADELGEDALALAVGDSVHDLPMLRRAARAFAPANAEPALATLPGVELARRPCQAGLLQAVSAFLGHAPRTCRVCDAPAAADADGRILLAVLGALDGTGREKAEHAARLALRVRSGAWRRDG